MNCLLESVATLYIGLHQRLFIKSTDDPLKKAQEDLEACKWQLEERSRRLTITASGLCQEAVARQRQGQTQPALLKFQEYKRCQTHLDKIVHGIQLINQQLDVLQSNGVDKQIMLSLRQSSQAMRAAGIESAAGEADRVMVDLEEQLRDASAFTSILTAPLDTTDDPADLESELTALLEDDSAPLPTLVSSMHTPVVITPVPGPTPVVAPTHQPEASLVSLEP